MERLLQSNPGLRSRFPVHLDFPDYSVDQLLRIAEGMAAERQYRLTTVARQRVQEMLRASAARAALATGNARLVRNLLERALRRQACRLVRGAEAGGPNPPPASGLADLFPEDFDVSLRALAGLIGAVPAPPADGLGALERLARAAWEPAARAGWEPGPRVAVAE